VPTFKAPRLPRRRTLAAAIAAGVVGSFLVTAAPSPASAQVVNCNPPHTYTWVTLYTDSSELSGGEIPPVCVGFVSRNAIYGTFQFICAGNNSGTVQYLDDNTGTYATHTFWPGGVYEVVNGTYIQGITTSNPDNIDIQNVTINAYSGSADCIQ
jgi:hypothetical protein